MSEPRLRVAVIGVGDFGRNHARVYSQIEDAKLVGVVDANAERAKTVAAGHVDEDVARELAVLDRRAAGYRLVARKSGRRQRNGADRSSRSDRLPAIGNGDRHSGGEADGGFGS